MKKQIALLGFIIFVILLAGCNTGENAIFYTIENEKQIVDNTLPNDVAVTGVIKTGNYFYVSIGTIYRRAQTSTTWEKITSNTESGDANGATILCNRLVSFNGKVYASLVIDSDSVENSSTRYGLYSTAIDTTQSTLNWSGPLIKDSLDNGVQIVSIFVVNNTLIVVTKENTSYKLYHSTDGNTFSSSSTSFSLLPGDCTYFNSSYWIIAGNKIYTSNDLSSFTELAESNYPDGSIPLNYFGGIYYSPSFDKLYVSSKNGYIYSTENGTYWQKSEQIKVLTKVVPLGVFYQITDNLIFLATDGYGFYRLNSSDITTSANILRFSDNTKAQLYGASVLSFFKDTKDNNPSLVFVCTAGYGLWSNDNSGTTPPFQDSLWKHE